MLLCYSLPRIMFLGSTPDGEVGLTRVGSSVLIDSFETLYKCCGELAKHVKHALLEYMMCTFQKMHISRVYSIQSTY